MLCLHQTRIQFFSFSYNKLRGCVLVLFQVLFGILLFVHLPNLDPYPGYMPLRSETVDDYEYEELSEGQQICPERHANIFDGKSVYIILISGMFA